MTRPAAPACVAFGIALALALGPSPAAQPGKKVHAVLILDTNSNLTKELEKSEVIVRQFLAGGLTDAVLSVTSLRGDEVTGEKIRKHIARLPVRPDDTLFVYVGGHGATVGGRHVFQFTGNGVRREEFVARDDIRALLTDRNPRLAVLMTDTCSDAKNLPLKPLRRDDDIKAFGVGPGPRGAIPCFEKLFLDTRGVVDINSSYENTMAWSFPVRGGVFTHALHKTFEQFERHERLTWDQFYEELKKNTQATYRTWRADYIAEHGTKFPLKPEKPEEAREVEELNKAYEDLKKQPRQTTQTFFLPDLWLQLLATGADNGLAVDELLVTSPLRRTPAADGLMPRDLIVAINGQPVEDTKGMTKVLREELAAAPGDQVTLTFKVVRNGETIDRRFTLAKPKR